MLSQLNFQKMLNFEFINGNIHLHRQQIEHIITEIVYFQLSRLVKRSLLNIHNTNISRFSFLDCLKRNQRWRFDGEGRPNANAQICFTCMVVGLDQLLSGQFLSKVDDGVMKFSFAILAIPPRKMVPLLPRFIFLPISPQSSKIPHILSLTTPAMFQIPISMKFTYHIHWDARTKMHAICILRNQVFEDTSVEKSGYKHVSKGGFGKIY